MSLEISGKLVSKLGQQTGQGKNGAWVKQEFIFETQEQYPKKVCISAWGDKVKELDAVSIGESVKVSINIESREFNGRWYTDIRAWRVERMNNNNGVPDLPPFSDDYPMPPTNDFNPDNDLPF
ncbi:MAG: DUF3127 domain-containing protein [Bacteroidales bacterium]